LLKDSFHFAQEDMNNIKKINREADCCGADEEVITTQQHIHKGDGAEKEYTEEEGHHQVSAGEADWKSHWKLLLALAILFVMLTLEFGFNFKPPFPFDLIIFIGAYLLAGYKVLDLAFRKAKRLDFTANNGKEHFYPEL
jgi:hypothetical protein